MDGFATAVVSYSGFPETITAPGNNSNSYGTSRANQYHKLKVVHRSINNWFGTDPSATPCTQAGVAINDVGVPCAFGVPASNTFGNSSNGSVRGPGYLNVDMSAFKDFLIVREQTLGFRFDAFNALNIPAMATQTPASRSTTFGQIASQGTPVRSFRSAICSSRQTTVSKLICASRPERSSRSLRLFFSNRRYT